MADIRAAEPELEELELRLEQVPMPTPPGFVIWRLAGTQPRTTLPHPPPRVWRGYLARAISNLTGRCPNCSQTAWVAADAPDPETHPAGWAHLEISFGVNHLPGCGAVFDDSVRRYFDGRAVSQ